MSTSESALELSYGRPFRFPESFLWGTSTAAFQVEGASTEEGRGESIWDRFCATPGKVAFGHDGSRAADQFHRYREDIELMTQLGAGAYRFSLAWPRIFPDGVHENPRGFDYYHRLIDALLEAGIRPAVTLYHWDLPQTLQDAGGWPARDTAYRYADYAARCFEALGDKVDFWITLNEPWCSSHMGYLYGAHAPGIKDRPAAYRAVHHLLLAHGLAVQAHRAGPRGGTGARTGNSEQTSWIGITINTSTPRAATRRPEDREAADRAADERTRLFLDPIVGRGYPQRHLAAYPGVVMPVQEGDMEVISTKVDFLGLNYYDEQAVRASTKHPEGFETVATHHETTDMGWDVVPAGLYRLLVRIYDEYRLPLYVTENGCATPDLPTRDGKTVHDPGRVAYLRNHFRAMARAMEDGVKLRGYFLWSFIDNFEWAEGYTKRFGIVYCDYQDFRRIPKDSFHFYREVIAGNEPL